MAGIRVLGIDQRQGDEVPAVFGPSFEQGDAREIGRRLHALADGALADGLQPDLQRSGNQVFVRPELAQRERRQVLGQLHELRDKLLRPRAKGQIDAPGRAKEVGDAGKVRAFDASKEQGRAGRGQDAAMDLGDFELRGNRGVHGDELAFAAQEVEELAQVVHGRLVVGVEDQVGLEYIERPVRYNGSVQLIGKFVGPGWLKAGLVVYILKKLRNGHFGPLVLLDHEDEALERKAVRSRVLGLKEMRLNRKITAQLLNRKITVQFWRAKGLSVRASNCLAMANITDEQELIEKVTTLDYLLALRNCGKQTAEEVWTFLTHLKPISNHHQRVETTSSNSGDDRSTEAQSVFVPLLDIEVSIHIWEVLQNTPVDSIRWSVRTRNVIGRQKLQELAEIAELSPGEWLDFRNFGDTSLTEIQGRMAEIIEQLRANPSGIEPSDEHSVETQSVFIPLLNTEISAHTWEAIQNMSIHQFNWSVRTQSVLRRQGFKTIAEIAEFSPREWLNFRNFGRKSLTEIQETVNKIVANTDLTCLDSMNEHSAEELSENSGGRPLCPNDPGWIPAFAEMTTSGSTACPTRPKVGFQTDSEVSQIQTLANLGHVVFQSLQTRQQKIIASYYGYKEVPKKLHQIGEMLGVTRERVRQIKVRVNKKINQGADNHLIKTTIFYLLSQSIYDVLAKAGGWCSVKDLRESIHQRLGWEDSDQWIIAWFDEAFGEAWVCLGTDDYKIIDGTCCLRAEERIQDVFTKFVARLQRYGYRPLALEECQYLIQKKDETAFDPDYLLNKIVSHPALKVHQYRKTLIGLKEWTWFSPEKPTTAAGLVSLIEWFLRMTNEPTTAKAIANGIGSELGNFRLTSFDVADICEKQPYLFFVNDNGTYGLNLWERASKYRQALTRLLSDEPLPIERITDLLYPQDPEETRLIVAALNFYTDSFVEAMPFEWALKLQVDKIEAKTDFDYTNLTFEDLMPKL